ncbi:MAG: polyprenyl synthetase family protein [Phycisphaerae bacterium]
MAREQIHTIALDELYRSIAPDVARAEQIFRDELESDQPFINELCQHVAQYHGKRVRPALVLLSGQACGVLKPAHHVLAAVVEMVHIATLVHDDVLDEADIRRRVATVNRLWGNERAVLLGDYLISHAFHLCSSLDSQYASRLIGRTTNTVCEGEMMQCANRDNFDLSEAGYFDIITRKTAVLLGVCCRLGARYAGADESVCARMDLFGESLGVAFQIVDDLIDLLGDEAEAGKSLGRDVEKGKLTLPLIHYLRTARDDERAAMLTLLRADDPQRYRQIARLLQQSESIDYAQDAAFRRINQALQALGELPPGDAKSSLTAMAEFVLIRRH